MSQTPPDFGPALDALQEALDGIPWMVIGGVAVVARGVPRTTRDLDLAVAGTATTLDDLLARLTRCGFTPRNPSPVAFAARTHVLLVQHAASALDIDLTIAWSPFEEEALAAAPPTELAARTVPVARAEDLIIYKLIGGRPVDMADVTELVAHHGQTIDLERIDLLVDQIAEALEDPARQTAWRRVRPDR